MHSATLDCRPGHAKCVQILANAGADVNAKEPSGGLLAGTPLRGAFDGREKTGADIRTCIKQNLGGLSASAVKQCLPELGSQSDGTPRYCRCHACVRPLLKLKKLLAHGGRGGHPRSRQLRWPWLFSAVAVEAHQVDPCRPNMASICPCQQNTLALDHQTFSPSMLRSFVLVGLVLVAGFCIYGEKYGILKNPLASRVVETTIAQVWRSRMLLSEDV